MLNELIDHIALYETSGMGHYNLSSVGEAAEPVKNYDLLSIIMLCLGGPDGENYDGALRKPLFLKLILSIGIIEIITAFCLTSNE